MKRLRKKPEKPIGCGSRFRTPAGTVHTYCNAAVPTCRATGEPVAPIARSVCARCRHGYAHVMVENVPTCRECRDDLAVEWGLGVQDECGVNLGWRKPEVMKRADYVTRVELPGTIKIKVPKPAA